MVGCGEPRLGDLPGQGSRREACDRTFVNPADAVSLSVSLTSKTAWNASVPEPFMFVFFFGKSSGIMPLIIFPDATSHFEFLWE